jgi:hypothetical protein
MRQPVKYKSHWIWPYNGYYDVHAPTAEPCSSSVIAEGMTMNEAKRFIDYTEALEIATSCPESVIGKIK